LLSRTLTHRIGAKIRKEHSKSVMLPRPTGAEMDQAAELFTPMLAR